MTADAAAKDQQKQSLYASHVKIRPRSVQGTFRKLKWAILWVLLGIYHVVPWIRWDRGPDAPDQAILMDLAGRRAYFFNIEIWPQEIYYVTGLLILGAVGLFFVTSLVGRVWCGFTCPQTVWTDLFLWVERKVEGDRNSQIKLSRQPFAKKFPKKLLKNVIWLVIAFLMSFAWVWYFNDAPSVTVDIFTGDAGGWVYAFVFMLTGTTFLLAGYAREQVCFYMCPWPRFQGAMFDEHSLIVTYEEWRGEARGKAPKDGNFEGRGHCVDCKMCVLVCPTGIDIRDGQQMQCIGCSLCIDACNSVMDRFDLPRGLITYDSTANQVARSKGSGEKLKFIRPRTIVYTVFLSLVAVVMLVSLNTRSRLDVTVLRDRAPLFVQLSSGDIRNAYTFKILNMERKDGQYELALSGIEGAAMTVVGKEEARGVTSVDLIASPDTVEQYRILVEAPRKSLKDKSVPLEFHLRDKDTGEIAEYDTVFVGPGR